MSMRKGSICSFKHDSVSPILLSNKPQKNMIKYIIRFYNLFNIDNFYLVYIYVSVYEKIISEDR